MITAFIAYANFSRPFTGSRCLLPPEENIGKSWSISIPTSF